MNEQFLAAICSGAVFVAIIETLRALGAWILNRWAKKKDHQEEKEEKKIDEQLEELRQNQEELKQNQKDEEDRMQRIEEALGIQKETNMFILYDRLKYLAKGFIKDGEISLEDRNTWNDMHECYHKNDGNGKLDALSDYINDLPIIKE